MLDYKVNRINYPQDIEIKVRGQVINKEKFTLIAGPCAVETKEQVSQIGNLLEELGLNFMRGGAYKPRTSPYSFQGLEGEGLTYLSQVREKNKLVIVSELVDIRDLNLFLEKVDIIQVGSRNMQNFQLLKALGRTNKPILLKRGMMSTLEEFISSAEYIRKEGNENIILCERGIRSFEPYTRNTLDLSAVPILKKYTNLPVFVDPSHGTGKKYLIEPMVKAAIVSGADGVILEIHPNPDQALCDGEQSLNMDEFKKLYKNIKTLVEFQNKSL